MPFGIKSSDKIYKLAKGLLEKECKLRCERGDDALGSNVVVDDILNSIRKALLLIADLTGWNPNVMWEIAHAQSLSVPFLLIAQSSGEIPFVLRHHRVLFYKNTRKGRRKLRKKLFKTVQKIISEL